MKFHFFLIWRTICFWLFWMKADLYKHVLLITQSILIISKHKFINHLYWIYCRLGNMQFTIFLNYVTHRVLCYMNMSINLQILWVQIAVLLTLVTCFNSALIKHEHCVLFRVFFFKKAQMNLFTETYFH